MSEMLDPTFPPFTEEQLSGWFAHAGAHRVNADRRPAWCPKSAQAAPAADALYDARRSVYYTKPVLRGWLRLIWRRSAEPGHLRPGDRRLRPRTSHR